MQAYFSTGMPAGLAQALWQVSAILSTNPTWTAFAFSVAPPVIILEADVSAEDVVQLASRQANGSISLGMPVLILGLLPQFPLQPGVPNPASVTLDLTGCIGCLSLASSKVHVYLSHLRLTGLERAPPPSAAQNSSVNGAALALPLWAFQFARGPGNASVHLYNVTLTLPREEFRLILAGLPATATSGPEPATAAGSGQPAGDGLLAGLNLQVRPSWPLVGH